MIKKILIALLTSIMIFSSLTLTIALEEETILEAHEEGVLIVQYEHKLNDNEKEDLQKEHGLTIKKQFKKEGLYVLKLNKNKDILKMIEKLEKKKDVLFVEPNYKLYSTDTAPYEPDFNKLWGLVNTSDLDIDADEAWDTTYGDQSVVVAVIDTGVDINHEDLQGQFLLTDNIEEYNFAREASDFYIPADDDHATHVSGTIAAKDNGKGIIGVAPDVRILPLKFLGPNGGYTDDAILAIEYASDKANIINASWGGGGYSNSLRNAINAFPGIFVAAAGNNGKNNDRKPYYPSSYDCENIISVAAIDSVGAKPRFSNYGLTSVDVGAPGVAIFSSLPENDYDYKNGTSMAAPHVAGTIALMMSHDPSLMDGSINSRDKIKTALYSTVTPLSALSRKTVTGGMINAKAALDALAPPPIDITPPYVVSTEPSQGGTIAPDDTISITFNENLDATIVTSNINIEPAVAYNTSVNGSTLIITSSDFVDGDYTLTIEAGAVADSSGNLYTESLLLTFHVVTPEPPELYLDLVTESIPSNRSRNIPISTNIVLKFDTDLTDNQVPSVNTDSITIVDKLLNTVPYEIIAINPTQIELDLSIDLQTNMRYTIRVDQGAFSIPSGQSKFYSTVFTTKK